MNFSPSRRYLSLCAAFALLHGASLLAQTTASKAASIPPGKSGTPSRSATAKGPLPDPNILDGSSLPAEKRSENGMIGEFELPGDENVRNGKVGGPQNPGGAGGQQSPGGVSVSLPMPTLPTAGGAAGQQGGQQGGLPNPLGGQQGSSGAAGGQQGGMIPPAGGQQGGGAVGGQPGGDAGQQGQGSPIAGGGDANASAQGIQVGQLGGEGGQDGQAGGTQGQGRPPRVAIGDSAMRIEQPAGGTPGVVGTQLPPGPVQQHDRGTGSGGKGAAGSGANKGVERGRAIPSGL